MAINREAVFLWWQYSRWQSSKDGNFPKMAIFRGEIFLGGWQFFGWQYFSFWVAIFLVTIHLGDNFPHAGQVVGKFPPGKLPPGKLPPRKLPPYDNCYQVICNSRKITARKTATLGKLSPGLFQNASLKCAYSDEELSAKSLKNFSVN